MVDNIKNLVKSRYLVYLLFVDANDSLSNLSICTSTTITLIHVSVINPCRLLFICLFNSNM